MIQEGLNAGFAEELRQVGERWMILRSKLQASVFLWNEIEEAETNGDVGVLFQGLSRAQHQKLNIASGPSSNATTSQPIWTRADLMIIGVGVHLCSAPTKGEPTSQMPQSG